MISHQIASSLDSAMAPFYPIYIARSDGKLEISSKGRRKESNQPTDEQLDRTPDAKGVSDFYVKLEEGDAKELDWRRKLGGMLVRELGSKEHQGSSGSFVMLSMYVDGDGIRNMMADSDLWPYREELHPRCVTRKLPPV